MEPSDRKVTQLTHVHAVCDASDDRSVLLPTALQCTYISNMQGFRENPIILSDLLRSNEVFPNN